MTAAAVSRPVLHLVPGTGHPRRARSRTGRSTGSLAGLAADAAGRSLGTVFAPVAARLAQTLAERAPSLVGRGAVAPWAAAIAFLLAEEARLFDYDRCVTRTSFARELDSSLSTLRRRSAEIRAALHPLDLDLPDPDDG